MPTPFDPRMHVRIQAMSRYANRHMSAEWPYMVGSTCLVILLIWQPLAPPSGVTVRPDTLYSGQRSLREIETNCLQNQVDTLAIEDCVENCSVPESPPPDLGLGASQFSRSILTCRDSVGAPSQAAHLNSPHNLIIEVVRASRTF